MPSSISRGPITTRLLGELGTEGFPVGDNTAPTMSFGWQGEPNDATATFIPWLTLMPGTAVAQSPVGTFGDSSTEWKLGYNVFYSGVTRKQTEALADRMRMALTNIARESVVTDTGSWRIQKITCTAIGSSTRIGSAYPDYFTQSDTFEVWITKG
jgi:hypothetical protein